MFNIFSLFSKRKKTIQESLEKKRNFQIGDFVVRKEEENCLSPGSNDVQMVVYVYKNKRQREVQLGGGIVWEITEDMEIKSGNDRLDVNSEEYRHATKDEIDVLRMKSLFNKGL